MSYQLFLDSLSQVEQDQSLFETELQDELQGIHHEELVKMGSLMITRLKDFANMGKFFAEQQPVDLLTKLTEALQEYELLLMPPKVFGGFCPCLKPARSGSEYDKRYLYTRSKVVSATYLSHSVIIESKAEKINMDSMHFADYTNKMNSLFNMLSSISTKGNEDTRNNAKKELLAALEMVNRFMRSFEEETKDFQNEVKRILTETSDLLSARSLPDAQPISRRILVKAQSSMQEIMNSSAEVSMVRAKEMLVALDLLGKELVEARENEVKDFNDLEDAMTMLNQADVLNRLREDSEIVHSDTSCKIRDATKRWSTVKAQSAPRPVVEYTEETVMNSSISMKGSGAVGDSTHKIMSEVGKKMTNIPKKGLQGGKSTVLNAVKFTTDSFVHAVDKVNEVVDKTVEDASSNIKKANQLLGIEPVYEPPTAAAKVRGSIQNIRSQNPTHNGGFYSKLS